MMVESSVVWKVGKKVGPMAEVLAGTMVAKKVDMSADHLAVHLVEWME